jgi:hypothetical protein
MSLAISAARFFVCKLYSVIGDMWGGDVRMTPQTRQDMQWWTYVSNLTNVKRIHRLVETTYLHTDSSSCGWGAVLNNHKGARGFWSECDEAQHISRKEQKAVRMPVKTFLL